MNRLKSAVHGHLLLHPHDKQRWRIHGWMVFVGWMLRPTGRLLLDFKDEKDRETEREGTK